ncbi:CHAT domain-containing protein [Actinomadura graeca]|uniref:CHAT domain-containing protein n=1 Tax=Actinomadura graeca TaxID=2750812 RepID=A0ABX8R050_9ACTN|nr:CHAT domain-containing protein [Actinomadura graeca]QXJ23347.1 CHAT domain-containing protein [Actinomadura graeca]
MAGQLGWLAMPAGPASLTVLIDGTEDLLAAWWRELDRAALEKLIGVWRAVLDHPEFAGADPEFRAACRDRAALALCWHASEIGDLEEIEVARRHLELALGETGRLGADLRYHLGLLFYNRAVVRGSEQDAQAAVTRLRGVLVDLPFDEDRLRPRCMDVLSRSLVWLHGHGSENVDLDEAVDLARDALVDLASASPYRDAVRVMLASALRARYRTSGRPADMAEAIGLLEATSAPRVFLGARSYGHSLHGMLLRERYARTGDETDLHRSLESHERAVAEAPEGCRSWLLALNNQANAFQAVYSLRGDVAYLRRALTVLRIVVEATDPADRSYAARLNNLGNSLSSAYEETKDRAYLDQSIDLYAKALEITSPTDAELSSRHLDLARSLTARHAARGRRKDYKDAVRHLRIACLTGLDRSPERTLDASSVWGAWASSRRAWKEAVEAYSFGVQVIEALSARQRNRPGGETWPRTAQAVPARAAYALVQAGRVEDAVLVQERARAALLDEEVPHRAGTPVLDLDAIYRAAGDRVLVYLGATEAGGFALIVDPAARKVRPVELPAVTGDAVRVRADLLANAYRAKDGDAATWLGAVDAVARWAHDAVLDRVVRRLPRDTGHCVLIPSGRLALLPLHAARGPGGRLVLDEVVLGYAPAARALRPDAAGTRVFAGALVVDDPQPVSAPPLPWSSTERVAAARMAERTTLLTGSDAMRTRVLGELASHGLVHLSCRGLGRGDAPLDSALLMAYDEPLTLRDLVELDVPARPRLIVLPACESFPGGDGAPEEVVGLPAGLLQAGCQGVLASQWAVSSLTSALVVAAFYKRCATGSHPAAALCGVQREFRGLTNADLAAALKPDRAHVTFGLSPADARPLWRAVRRRDPQAMPFAHATEWAAFAYTGG